MSGRHVVGEHARVTMLERWFRRQAPQRVVPRVAEGLALYAIGDIRAGSTKRVAAAVGEGAQVVAALHAYLAAQAQAAAAHTKAPTTPQPQS